jgi:hypothetical protein
MKNNLAIFEGYKIRRHYDEKTETWFFSVVDIVAALTDSVNPRDYWFKMKIRVKSEDGIELSTICRQLKMKAPDGKMRLTDCGNVEGFTLTCHSCASRNPLSQYAIHMTQYEYWSQRRKRNGYKM